MKNPSIKQSDIKACVNNKLNDEIAQHFLKYLEQQETIAILSSYF